MNSGQYYTMCFYGDNIFPLVITHISFAR
jgi:hypothetical protein